LIEKWQTFTYSVQLINKPYSTLLVISHCVLWACALVLHQQKGWDTGGGWGHPQGDMHMVAARLEKAMVGTKWATSCPDCMDKLRKHHSHTCRGLVSGEEGCLGSERVYDNR